MPLVVLLTVAGLHVPLMPLVDVLGSVGTLPPSHILNEVPKLKVGVVLGVTVILIDTCNAHCPDVGVNV